MRRVSLLVILLAFGCAEGAVNNVIGGGGSSGAPNGYDPDCIDADGDGFGDGCAPNASESCDGKDNDCDGRVDEDDACELGPGTPPPNNGEGPKGDTPENCSDVDGDGFGAGCASGSDCDESDALRYDGAPELCDGKDNDCDGTIDEGFDVGMACTSGLGVCERTGTMRCSADESMDECGATEGPASAEVCDDLDNDCDGVADDGLNCNVCIEDGNEPNDSSLTGTPLPSGGSVNGKLCSGNVDWFRLGDYSAGQTVSVTALFSHQAGDIEMEMYVGATFEVGAYSGTDNESISRTLSKSGAVTVRLFHAGTPGVTGNAYTIQR